MMEGITNNITNDQNNLDLRVIVIKAEGPIFSAGHNLKELVLKIIIKKTLPLSLLLHQNFLLD